MSCVCAAEARISCGCAFEVRVYTLKLLFAGLKFWKVGSRKFYAINGNDIRGKSKGKCKRTAAVHDYNESDDDETAACHNQLMKELVKQRKEVSVTMNIIPNRSYFRLAEVFKCNICLSVPLHPSVAYSSCCYHIIGCCRCVEECKWLDSGCPLC